MNEQEERRVLVTEPFIPDWLKGLRCAFSRRDDGQMSFKRADEATVSRNRREFLDRWGLNLDDCVAGELIHGNGIVRVTGKDRGRGANRRDWFPETDGFVTADPGVLLLTTHADCAPVVIYDPVERVLGQAHCGWKGLAAGILPQLVNRIIEQQGSSPDHLCGWIGPTIHQECYPVGEQCAQSFPEQYSRVQEERIYLDLVGFALGELQRLGLRRENLSESGICTACDTRFSSFRRDGEAMQAMCCVTGL